MRIITWNIFYLNRKARKAILHALSNNPDILCLQEVSQKTLQWIKTIPSYVVNYSYDFTNRNPDKNWYICTLTKQHPLNVREILYDDNEPKTLLTRFYKLIHNTEHHAALVVELPVPEGRIQVVNTRLSCAVGTCDRLMEFETIRKHVHYQSIPTIFCGDFNVVDSMWFNKLTGWMRGFTKQDYRIDERQAFESLYKDAKLINIFRGRATMFFKKPLLQLDHILVPTYTSVTHAEIVRKRFGSDHRMLLADITLKHPPTHA